MHTRFLHLLAGWFFVTFVSYVKLTKKYSDWCEIKSNVDSSKLKKYLRYGSTLKKGPNVVNMSKITDIFFSTHSFCVRFR